MDDQGPARSQNEFKRVAKLMGWAILEESGPEGHREHWDFIIEKAGHGTKRVDVKSRKKLRRSDPESRDDWQWIELHGVNHDDSGWLFNSKSHWIVFETSPAFIIVDRMELISLIARNVDMTSVVSTPEEARYKVYSRQGRADAVTLIETGKLLKVATFIWEK